VADMFSDEEFDDVEDKTAYRTMLTRDERRFKTADRDGDGIATRDEFTAFLHPEEFHHMRDVIVQVGAEAMKCYRDDEDAPASGPEPPRAVTPSLS